MRGRWSILLFLLAACASAPPPPPPKEPPAAELEPAKEEAPAEPSAAAVDAPERSRPPSTATYDQAMAEPESLDVKDNRPHLTDDQLRGPMRNIISACPVPKNAKVTIRTAVQSGRAIGVSVDVRFEVPYKPPPKRMTKWQAKQAALAAQREAKAKKKIADCVDHAVRAVVWPPSGRRDSFTTEF